MIYLCLEADIQIILKGSEAVAHPTSLLPGSFMVLKYITRHTVIFNLLHYVDYICCAGALEIHEHFKTWPL